jgi:hypothetical protein
MGVVLNLTLVFIVISLFIKKLAECVAFLKVSNLKYKLLDFIGKFSSLKVFSTWTPPISTYANSISSCNPSPF